MDVAGAGAQPPLLVSTPFGSVRKQSRNNNPLNRFFTFSMSSGDGRAGPHDFGGGASAAVLGSDEVLTCGIHQLEGPKAALLAAFRHNRHVPWGALEVRLQAGSTNVFVWPCRSERALRLLLQDVRWRSSCVYFMVLHRGGNGSPPKLDEVLERVSRFPADGQSLCKFLSNTYLNSALWRVELLYMRGQTNWIGSRGGGWPQPALRRCTRWWGSAKEGRVWKNSADAEAKKEAKDKRTIDEAFVLLAFLVWITGWHYLSSLLSCC